MGFLNVTSVQLIQILPKKHKKWWNRFNFQASVIGPHKTQNKKCIVQFIELLLTKIFFEATKLRCNVVMQEGSYVEVALYCISSQFTNVMFRYHKNKTVFPCVFASLKSAQCPTLGGLWPVGERSQKVTSCLLAL